MAASFFFCICRDAEKNAQGAEESCEMSFVGVHPAYRGMSAHDSFKVGQLRNQYGIVVHERNQ